MNFSIHTSEADNGFILDVNITGVKLSKTFKSCHEVYADWKDVKERMQQLTRGFEDRLMEMILEKPIMKDEIEGARGRLGGLRP